MTAVQEGKTTAVTWAVLGLIQLEPRSGYDLKRVIDRTIRHFWAASYGQIYPELARLEGAGWIQGADAANGGRSRRVFSITPVGRQALVDWLHGEETRIELRDESLLRLFFADALPREDALGLLHARQIGYGALLAQLRALDDGSGEPDPDFVDLVYRWGLEYCEWGVEWCRRHEQRLRSTS
jgi:DNA-binding PadR family transcriptional regulator